MHGLQANIHAACATGIIKTAPLTATKPMSTALVILPDFLLILIGFSLARWMGFQPGFWDGLEKLIYYLLFPALLFRSLVRTPIDVSTATPLVLAGASTLIIGMMLSYAAKWLFRPRERLFASCFQCGFRFNTYVGFAVAGSLNGQQGIAGIAILAGAMIPLANVASVWALARHGKSHWLKELARNPLMIATVAGALASMARFSLPRLADHMLEALAGASLPMGLIAVGAGLKAMRLDESPAMMSYLLAVKLLALPLIAWAIGRVFGLEDIYLTSVILLAALPPASSAFILAARMGGEGKPVATLISIGTLLSMVTMPLWVALLL